MDIKTWCSLICCTFFILVTTGVYGLHLGAFNVRVFGPSKAAKHDVMGILAKISVRYDILLIQEIRDIKGQAIEKLIQRIQQDYGVRMKLITSDRLGRTTSKEQYAFLYRADHGISVVDSFHFDDGDESSGKDLFQREPFIVRFKASQCKVSDFTLVALHAAIGSKQTVPELTALTQVVETIQETWDTPNILILGDLNADCDYVPKKAWPGIPIRQNSLFWWPIGDDVDTTVNSNTHCAYDRFIVAGNSLKKAVIHGSAKPFDFQQEYGLPSDQALAVSDHYPIELALEGQEANKQQASNGASEHSGIMETLQHLWHGFVQKFAKRKSLSEL